MLLELNEGVIVIYDDAHHSAVDEWHWRAYSHDDGLTWEVATDLLRDDKRTTMMLSRFLMEHILGRELSEREFVRRIRHYCEGGYLDYRDHNLVLEQIDSAK